MTTKAPRDSPGGMVRLGLGEEETRNVDFRWAGSLGNSWHTRVTGGARRTDLFSVSRLNGTEYCLSWEECSFG